MQPPADASASAATPPPGDTEDAPDDVVDGEVLEEPAAEQPETVTAQTIVGEWLERAPKRPPGSVIGQVAKTIRVLLEEDRIDPYDIRRGIATWMSKGLHPATLPSVVNQVMNAGAPAPRSSTGHGYDPDSGTDLFDRAMERAKARDAAAAAAAEGGAP
ncbi:hypothetical protein ACIOG7_10570 [Streptomyces sp. NPDC087894]|uniref:hypothetical protein n=1 Tax=Streptomyces sp. NPDC087894 TaxID=3365816 RepID=UPI0038154CF1